MSNDALDRTTEVAVQITESGINGKTNSRFVAAVDRLGGNLLEYFNARLERGTRRARAISDGEVKIIAAAAEAAAREIDHDPGVASRAIEGHFGDVIRKQANREAVLIEAHKVLEHPDGPVYQDAPADVVMDDDWLNYFESYAEKATSERMRKLLGRILSGEIRRPGSFSYATLRVASELDTQTAQIFRELIVGLVGDRIWIKDRGNKTSDALRAEAAGLLTGVGGILSITLPPEFVEKGEMAVDGKFILTFSAPKRTKITIKIYPLTSAGMEIASILPVDAEATARRIAEVLAQKATVVRLHPIFIEGGQAKYRLRGEVLKGNPETDAEAPRQQASV